MAGDDRRAEGAGERGATAAALLDAAEQHFADDGFDRASLRAVMRAAGTDPGSIHYHFGGRPELAAAVLDRFLAPLNARRLELLELAIDDADHDGTIVSPDRLVDALVRPDVEVATDLDGRGPGRARLVGSIYLAPATYVTERVEAHFGPVAARFQPELARSLPHVAAEVMAWRVRWIVFGTLGAVLSDPQEPSRRSVDDLLDRLVTDLTAALAAPTDPASTTGPASPTDRRQEHP